MATNTAGTNARELATQQTHFFRLRLLGTNGNGTFPFGYIPNGGALLRIYTISRNASGLTGGAATISIGTAGSPATFFAANGTPVTSTGFTTVTIIAANNSVFTADTQLVAVIAGTPTGGAVDVILEYVPQI